MRISPAAKSRCALLAMLLLIAMNAEARFCAVWTSPTAFGSYPPMTPAPVDTTGTVSVLCLGRRLPGQGNGYVLRIDGGNSGDPANRYMLNGPGQLFYNLYKNAGRNNIWGDGTSGTTPVSRTIGNRRFFFTNHTVYGRAFPSQDPPAGQYLDIVTVTIEF